MKSYAGVGATPLFPSQLSDGERAVLAVLCGGDSAFSPLYMLLQSGQLAQEGRYGHQVTEQLNN